MVSRGGIGIARFVSGMNYIYTERNHGKDMGKAFRKGSVDDRSQLDLDPTEYEEVLLIDHALIGRDTDALFSFVFWNLIVKIRSGRTVAERKAFMNLVACCTFVGAHRHN